MQVPQAQGRQVAVEMSGIVLVSDVGGGVCMCVKCILFHRHSCSAPSDVIWKCKSGVDIQSYFYEVRNTDIYVKIFSALPRPKQTFWPLFCYLWQRA